MPSPEQAGDVAPEQAETEAAETTAETTAEHPEPTEHAEAREPAGPVQETEQPSGADRASREAAKYRTRLRETEAERDVLRGQLEASRRHIILSLAQDLSVPEDLFDIGGVVVEDLLDDSGGIESQKVDAAIAGLLEKRPGLRRQVWPDMGQFKGGGFPREEKGWSDVFREIKY